MPAWIIAHSEVLCNFLIPVLVNFTAAQQQHALNFIEALLVCPAKHKTLAALTRLLRLPHADEYALADFFRVSPWPSPAVRRAVTCLLLRTVVGIQTRTGWRLLFLSLDDALCRKDVATSALEAVGLHYDHTCTALRSLRHFLRASMVQCRCVVVRRQKDKCTNASHYVLLHLQLGPVQFTLTWRLHSVEAILNWHTLVFAAYAFIQYRRVAPLVSDAQATLPSVAAVLTEHQGWHARQAILHIAQQARQGASDAELLAAFFPT